MDLPAYRDQGEANQNDGNPFSQFFSAVLALLFGAIGVSFCLYGVYKSREIGGWAVWIVLLGWLFFAPASYFFLAGVLGWSLL